MYYFIIRSVFKFLTNRKQDFDQKDYSNHRNHQDETDRSSETPRLSEILGQVNGIVI